MMIEMENAWQNFQKLFMLNNIHPIDSFLLTRRGLRKATCFWVSKRPLIHFDSHLNVRFHFLLFVRLSRSDI